MERISKLLTVRATRYLLCAVAAFGICLPLGWSESLRTPSSLFIYYFCVWLLIIGALIVISVSLARAEAQELDRMQRAADDAEDDV